MFDWFAGYSRFPTDSDFFGTAYTRYHTIFLGVALPLCVLGMLGRLPLAPQLIAAWGVFWASMSLALASTSSTMWSTMRSLSILWSGFPAT